MYTPIFYIIVDCCCLRWYPPLRSWALWRRLLGCGGASSFWIQRRLLLWFKNPKEFIRKRQRYLLRNRRKFGASNSKCSQSLSQKFQECSFGIGVSKRMVPECPKISPPDAKSVLSTFRNRPFEMWGSSLEIQWISFLEFSFESEGVSSGPGEFSFRM